MNEVRAPGRSGKSLPEMSINRHVFAYMLSGVLLLFGIISFDRIGVDRFPAIESDQFRVILRGSRDVARRTVDLYEIWNGEISFGPFRVGRRE